jgi:hypothetical protein
MEYCIVRGATYFEERSKSLRTTTGPRVRAPFHPKNSFTGEDRRALGRIGNIQNTLLKALYEKGSPKNSSTGGHVGMLSGLCTIERDPGQFQNRHPGWL